jgi:AcrR family transcriptional regulator
MQEMRTAKEMRAAETRAALLAVARRLFSRKGYAATGTEEIVAAAKVTRGALYHHFADKRALFDALVETIAEEIFVSVEKAAVAKRSAVDGLIAGCRAYIDACLAPDVRRIYIVDAQSVLGPKRWREIEAAQPVGSLADGVREALAETRGAGIDANALAVLLSGALDEAVLHLVNNDDKAARGNIDRGLERLIRRTVSA